jgi:NAD(P) transhydrogenase
VGGVAINTGTIPSKALREAILRMVGRQSAMPRAADFALARDATFSSLVQSCQQVIRAEIDLVTEHFSSNGIELINGTGSFKDSKTIEVSSDRTSETITADYAYIATGTRPAKPDGMAFDDNKIVTSDEILHLGSLPRSIIVVGGGVIGTEYASMLAAIGIRVTLIEGRPRLLDFVDAEIAEALQYHLRQSGATLRMGEKVVTVKLVAPTGPGARPDTKVVEAVLESGKTLRADCLLYCAGRQGATDRLNLAAAGLAADERGRIKVNKDYQTEVPNIYAGGDVIGFPALASTSMEQGRAAALHMFGQPVGLVPDLLPYGIYSIPEISMVGWTEERLTKEGVPYEAGIAQYKEIARGQLLGDEIGMMKLLIHQESHALLGAHVIGTGATELIHIGQAVMAFKGTVEYFVDTVFNYPTLAECYKVAALNGLNKLRNV